MWQALLWHVESGTDTRAPAAGGSDGWKAGAAARDRGASKSQRNQKDFRFKKAVWMGLLFGVFGSSDFSCFQLSFQKFSQKPLIERR